MKSEGKPSNGSPKPDGIKSAGSALSPEIIIVVVVRITLRSSRNADVVDPTEGSSPKCDMVSVQDSTGVLDQGMYSQG